VAAADLPFEYAMNALRLNDGFELPDFERRTGLPGAALEPALAQGAARGLIERDGARVRPSARGRALLNQLTGLFLP
jgi:coproporphyrinogen III oxidase-like Fe-S oxidoreductase